LSTIVWYVVAGLVLSVIDVWLRCGGDVWVGTTQAQSLAM